MRLLEILSVSFCTTLLRQSIAVNYTISTVFDRQAIISLYGVLAMQKAYSDVVADLAIPQNLTFNFPTVSPNNASDESESFRTTMSAILNGANALIGPYASCYHESRIATVYGVTTLSPNCRDDRTIGAIGFESLYQLTTSAKDYGTALLLLLRKMSWFHITVLLPRRSAQPSVDAFWQQIRPLLLADNVDLRERHYRTAPVGELNITAYQEQFARLLLETYLDTRVYVFVDTGFEYGYLSKLFGLAMARMGLLQTGEYFNINLFSPNDLSYAYWDDVNADAWVAPPPTPILKQKLVVSHSDQIMRGRLLLLPKKPMNFSTANFMTNILAIGRVMFCPLICNQDQGNDYVATFQNASSRVLDKLNVRISIFRAYDALNLLMRAVLKTFNNTGDVKPDSLKTNLYNRTVQSILGYQQTIDTDRFLRDNVSFYMLAYDNSASRIVRFSAFSFAFTNNTLIMEQLRSFPWIAGQSPLDVPPCGFDGKAAACIKTLSLINIVIIACASILFLLVLVVAVLVYRYWKQEKELTALLWKIHLRDLMLHKGTGSRFGSVRSLGGSNMGSTTSLRASYHSLREIGNDTQRASLQPADRTDVEFEALMLGLHKGQIVSIKRIYKENIVVNRQLMKELKLMRDLLYDNLNKFLGAVVEPHVTLVVAAYCQRGSLRDLLEDEIIKLDQMFLASIVFDIIKGLEFLHASELQCHGRLKSTNCLVDSRWVVRLADYGLFDLRLGEIKEQNEDQYCRSLLWTAPEHLRESESTKSNAKSKPGDVYAFGIILHEIFGRKGPFGIEFMDPIEAVSAIRHPTGEVYYRPDMKVVMNAPLYIQDLMMVCWAETPSMRPDVRHVKKQLKPLQSGLKSNIFDNVVAMMEKYSNNLEEIVAERTDQLKEEQMKSEKLLLQMLPKSVAEQLKKGQHVDAQTFDSVTIYFSDVVGFQTLVLESTPYEIVDFLNDMYTCFDDIITSYDVYKVETIGDSYMVASGLPVRNGDVHVGEIASMALHLLEAIRDFKIRHRPDEKVMLRIGMNSGSCVAGVVGLKMPRYCLFGDTVNTASRMESNGEALKIHCSRASKELLDKLGGYIVEPRGYITIKGKGELLTYWVQGESKEHRRDRLKFEAEKKQWTNKVVNDGTLLESIL